MPSSWEQRKLGNVTTILGGNAWSSSDYSEDGSYLIVTIANVTGEQYIDDTIGNRITTDHPREYKLSKDDILVSLTGNVGRVSRMTSVNALLNQRVGKLTISRNVSDNFIFQTLRASRFIDTMQKAGQGAAQQNISNSDVLNYEFNSPQSKQEQELVGTLFDRLDSLITLHQRKYEKLSVLKKSLLEKMFPREGENKPEVRFAGFTDPWEQRKLGELAHRVTRKNEENQSDLPLTISAQHGLVDQRDYFNNQVASRDMSGYYLLENGEFAYNKSTSGDSPWGVIKRLTKYEKGCLSTLYICFGLDQGDPDFLVTYYETNRWHKAVQMIAAEGARNHGLLNIAPDDFFETVLTLPSSTDEQKQIGRLFARLDTLITLHQRKLEKLKQLKQSMLEKMFI